MLISNLTGMCEVINVLHVTMRNKGYNVTQMQE